MPFVIWHSPDCVYYAGFAFFSLSILGVYFLTCGWFDCLKVGGRFHVLFRSVVNGIVIYRVVVESVCHHRREID